MSLILVHSPKGGVGTTTVAANLASAFARRGQEAVAVDLSGQDALGLHLGRRPDATGDANLQPDDAIEVLDGVRLLSTGRRSVSERDPSAAVRLASNGRSIVLVDLAAGDEDTLRALLPHASLRLCVLTAEPGTLNVLPPLLERHRPMWGAETAFVLNRVDERLRLTRDIVGFLRATLGRALVGAIRRDEAVNEALAMLTPLDRHAPASAALDDIGQLAERLVSEDMHIGDRSGGLRGVA